MTDQANPELTPEVGAGGSPADPAGRRSYRTGRWFGIFGPGATVLLPPSEKARVAPLWELVDAGAGFDEVLDALLSSGLRGLPGFVLVSQLDGATKVVLRGEATAQFVSEGETVELAGSPTRPGSSGPFPGSPGWWCGCRSTTSRRQRPTW
ncbi:MAG: hypothetical protein R2731_13810 [Nocardioides sp.]